MKKIITLIMSLFMICSLMACNNTSTQEQQPAQQEQQVAIKDDIAYIMLTVNPAIEICVDSSEIITMVNPCNEDAKIVLQELELEDQIYSIGLRRIIDSIYEKGYLKEDKNLVISSQSEKNLNYDYSALTKSTRQVCDEFKKNTGLNIGIELYIEPNQNEDNQHDYQDESSDNNQNFIDTDHRIFNGVELPPEVEITARDDKGNILQTIEKDSAGTEIIKDYDSEGNLRKETLTFNNGDKLIAEIDEEGNRIENFVDAGKETSDTDITDNQEHQKDTGTKESVDADGNRRVDEWLEDGTHIITVYYSDGTYHTDYINNEGRRVREVFTTADGWYYDLTPYEDGRTYIDIHIKPDGTYNKYRYKPNGDNIDFYTEFPDGLTSYRVANPNGSIASEIINRPDGSHAEFYFDLNGIITSSYETWVDGTSISVTYHSNGVRKEDTRTYPDGKTCIYRYDENENLLEEIWTE